MEETIKPPSAVELLRKIQELEERHARLKQKMSKLMLSHNQPQPNRQTFNSPSFRRAIGGALEPLDMKLTDAQYLNILQSMGQALHIYDHNHRIFFWNRCAEILYGYTSDEALGKTPTELLAQPKDAKFAEFVLDRTVGGESWSGEFPIINKNREKFVVVCANTPIRDENRSILGAMCLSTDSRPFQVMKPGFSTSAPMRLNSQQPQPTSIASKISNLASKVKLKIENYTDQDGGGDHIENILDESSTPRGHISPSPFGVFFSTDTEEHFSSKLIINSCEEIENKTGIRNILSSKAEALMGKKKSMWPWKNENENENKHESLLAKVGRFGWRRLDHNQEHEFGSASANIDCKLLANNNSGINKIEASGLWFSSVHVDSISSTSSSSSAGSSQNNAIIKVEKGTDGLDYEISWEDLIMKEQIGQGSCGTVYHALWYGSDVAVKLFAHQEYSDDVMLSFKKEVSLMKRLRHPNILLFMGAVTSPQHLGIVTEFLPRGSLFQILQRNSTRLDWRRRLHMAMDIARGMHYLHSCNPPIVHRDLKSSNLLVDKNWTVKVGDFGLSRIRHETYLNTKTGKGTPQWMAPEILRNQQADEKSDVYGYGVVLWEIITEKIPWDNLDPMQVIGAVGFMNRRLEIPKDVDPQWVSLIESCWCSEPESRPTFQEILYNLKEMQKKYAAERRR